MPVKNILIVEDDLNLNRVFTKYLSGQGYDVESVHSCSDATDLLTSGDAPDVVIVDFELSDGNSVPLLRMLEQPEYKNVKVIVCSGKAYSPHYGINVARVNQFLLKPVSPRELTLLVNVLTPK
ncbi:MAG: response regulator [Anaerolineae bacterium]